jgi:hypothetical protein
MTVHALREKPPPELAKALAEFEARFTYPLGPGRSFRISHGEDYARFFRATLMPDGSARQVAYIGDLKIDPAARGGAVLLRLGLAALAWGRPQVSAAYGVVMEGTPASPTTYSGRAGLPAFLQVGRVFVLRFAKGAGAAGESDDRWSVSPDQGMECYRSLSRGRYAAWGGAPAERSEIAPVWLMHPDAAACGRLEDTRRAKRLTDEGGTEMLSAHLSCFAWKTPAAGAEIIHQARQRAAVLGFPALFVSVAECDMAPLADALGDIEKVVAPASVYGAALPGGLPWNINTSEI